MQGREPWQFTSVTQHLGGCVSLLSITMINTITKSNLGWKRYISPYSLEFIMKQTQGRNQKGETEAETREEHYSSWLLQPPSASSLIQPRQLLC